MMFLTVIFNVLALSEAIRVPVVWPENTNTIRNLDAVNIQHADFSAVNNLPSKGNTEKSTSYVTDLRNTADSLYAGISGLKGHTPIGSQKSYVADSDKFSNEFIRASDNQYNSPTKSKHQMRPHIRIPIKIKSKQNKHNRNVPRNNGPRSNSFSQPLVYTDDNTNLPKSADGWIPIVGQPNYQKAQESSRKTSFQNRHNTQNLNQKTNQQGYRKTQDSDHNINHQIRQKTQEVKQEIDQQNNKKVQELKTQNLNQKTNHQGYRKPQDSDHNINHQIRQKTQEVNQEINRQNNKKVQELKTQNLNQKTNHQGYRKTQDSDHNINHQIRQKTQEVKQETNRQNNKKVQELNRNVNHQGRQKKQDLNKKVNYENYQKSQDLNYINTENPQNIHDLTHNANHENRQKTLIRNGNQYLLQTQHHKNPNSGVNRSSPNKYPYNPQQQYVINQNYRDDTTHENKTEDIDGDEIKVSQFESLKDALTAPIYPGEGKWATRGIKQKSHLRSHKFTPLIENDQDKPDGYETFEKAVPVFERQSRKVSERLRNFQQKHPSIKQDDDKTKPNFENDYNDKNNNDNEFVPTRTLAQVRKTDSRQHLPRDPEDYRLREAVKDSKIHTVYTEEGYEDIAYDHEGHEKNAEDSEGYSRFQKSDKKSKQKLPKRVTSGFEAVDVQKEFENYSPPSEDNDKESVKYDSDVSASGNGAYRVPKSRIKVKMVRNENMTKEIKNSDNGEMEITSEIKIMTKPNNVSTSHKFVKIVPKSINRGTKRYKRYVNDFHKVNVEEDFLDVLGTENPKVTTITTAEKYPYYKVNTKELNINSPLRYAEDLNNAPLKIAGKMSFYEQAKLSECPEIPRNIDPLPDKIKKDLNKNKELKNKDSGYANTPNLPRLSNLGDKIDCLKTKLFGDNPLDSPLFQEQTIREPEPIFEDLKRVNMQTTTKGVTAEALKQQSDLVDSVQRIDKLQEKLEILPKPSEASLPDQIVQTTEEIISTTDSVPHSGNLTFLNGNSKNNSNNSKLRLSKSLNSIQLNKENATNLNGAVARLNTINSENKELPPTAEALRVLLKRRKRPQRPLSPIFDVNKFLPSPLPPIPTFFTSTILPKYKTLSEVYYKDDIQPNEQLNVFADIINNIKNSPKETLTAESTNYFPVIEETWSNSDSEKSNNKKIKIPPRRVRIKNKDSSTSHSNIKSSIYNIGTTSTTTTTTTTTTPSPRYRRRNKFKNHKLNSQVFEEYLQTVKQNVENLYSNEDLEDADTDQTTYDKKKRKPYETNTNFNNVDEITSFYNPILNQDISSGFILDEVVGLSPPAPISSSQITTLNTYVVSGMKPPKVGKPYVYSSFRIPQNNRVRRKNYYHRRSKRSPLKTTYSEIKRTRPSLQIKESVEEKEETDDYVPNRNRNFHYDVENDKVVYLNNNQNDQKETVVEIETEEDEADIGDDEEYLTIVKPSMKPFVLVTTEANGPSFLDYIQRLKNDSSYRPIKEPDPKEKLKEMPVLMNPENIMTRQIDIAEAPGFLSIISKLKADEGYKEIKEKKATSITTSSPQIDTFEIDKKEEEVNAEDVKQTKRNRLRNTTGNLHNIFDINEYLPQPEDHTVKTVIDYSKYKTIQRAPVTRHNLSSHYNSEESDFPESRNITQLNPSDNIEKESETKKVYQNIRRTGYSSSEEVQQDDTEQLTTKSVIPTKSRSIRIRTRNRTRQTLKPVTTTTATPETTRKRIRLRSRPTTTTESSVTTRKPTEKRKFVRRRIERVNREELKIPPNHKPYYSPISAGDEKTSPRGPVMHKKRKVPGPSQKQEEENKQLDEDERSANVTPNKLLQVEVFKKYDLNQRHGGNYRKEEDSINSSQTVEVNSLSPNAYKDHFDEEATERLSDIVPKPFAFYSDPMLPKTVNHLKDSKQADNAEESDNAASAKPEKDYNDEVVINFNKNTETVSKKPIQFVKDPSKRLYFYVPVK